MPARAGPAENLSTLLRYGVPLAIAAMIGLGLANFYNFMISKFCTPSAVGDYSVAAKFTAPIAVLSAPVADTLFPTFTKLRADTDLNELRKLFRCGEVHRLVDRTLAAGVTVASRDLIRTLLPRYRLAPRFLTLSAAVYLHAGLGYLAIGGYLSGQGRMKVVTS